mmetsp:Transcript_4581/g.8695  ORF Transcript_4581/g.8695 Transcript_4581/m.8695 type:complete len:119 (+) Transcript_4581:1175-1531(+)|eukprot:scaffold7847_cov86-Amphora_coffeaeformis.AAC.1
MWYFTGTRIRLRVFSTTSNTNVLWYSLPAADDAKPHQSIRADRRVCFLLVGKVFVASVYYKTEENVWMKQRGGMVWYGTPKMVGRETRRSVGPQDGVVVGSLAKTSVASSFEANQVGP